MAKKSGKAKRGAGKPKRAVKAAKPTKAKGRAPAKRGVVAKRPAAKRTSAAAARRPTPPPPDPVRELAKRIIDLTVAHDDEGTLALYADNVESIERGAPPMVGIEAIKQKFQMWRGMTSNAEFRPRKVCVDGNTIMIEWEGTVTLAPSGKITHLDEVAVHEIENGKIVRERYYYDPSVLQQ